MAKKDLPAKSDELQNRIEEEVEADKVQDDQTEQPKAQPEEVKVLPVENNQPASKAADEPKTAAEKKKSINPGETIKL